MSLLIFHLMLVRVAHAAQACRFNSSIVVASGLLGLLAGAHRTVQCKNFMIYLSRRHKAPTRQARLAHLLSAER
jgi:hypothetical protein